MRRLMILALIALLSLGATAAADSGGKAPPPSTSLAEIGAWFDRGLDRVSGAASDLWAASKAAVAAGAATLRERGEAREQGQSPDLAGK